MEQSASCAGLQELVLKGAPVGGTNPPGERPRRPSGRWSHRRIRRGRSSDPTRMGPRGRVATGGVGWSLATGTWVRSALRIATRQAFLRNAPRGFETTAARPRPVLRSHFRGSPSTGPLARVAATAEKTRIDRPSPSRNAGRSLSRSRDADRYVSKPGPRRPDRFGYGPSPSSSDTSEHGHPEGGRVRFEVSPNSSIRRRRRCPRRSLPLRSDDPTGTSSSWSICDRGPGPAAGRALRSERGLETDVEEFRVDSRPHLAWLEGGSFPGPRSLLRTSTTATPGPDATGRAAIAHQVARSDRAALGRLGRTECGIR